MGDAVSSEPDAPTVDDEGARERRRLIWIAVVAGLAVVAALVVVGFVARPGSSSSTGSSESVVPSPDPTFDGSGTGDLATCTPEQAAVLPEVQAALPWEITSADASSGDDPGDGTCLGPEIQVAQPYDDVVAALPDALAGAGIQVTQDQPVAGLDGSSTFTGTSSSGLSIGLLVAEDQGVGTVIGVYVAPPSAG
jgi:hypothetical protein